MRFRPYLSKCMIVSYFKREIAAYKISSNQHQYQAEKFKMNGILYVGHQETLNDLEQKQNQWPNECLIAKTQPPSSTPLNQNSNTITVSYQQTKTETQLVQINSKRNQDAQTIVGNDENEYSQNHAKSQSIPPKLTIIKKYPQVICFKDMIKEGQYSRNRVYLYGWMKNQCEKFKLQYQTYANSVALMDQFYKYMPFDKEKFIMTALCFIILSSKSLQTKVLFTSTVAKANNFKYQQMLKVEEEILIFFQFLVTNYSFASVVCEYMRRWDCQLEALGANMKEIFFFKEKKESYIQYMELMFLSQCHMRHKGSLLHPSIKKIFNLVLNGKANNEINCIIDRIFAEPCYQASKQVMFAYNIDKQMEQIEASLHEWRKEFREKSQPVLQMKFEERNKYKSYSEFMCMLLP